MFRSFELAPRPDTTGSDTDERTSFEIVTGVLLVLLFEGCNPSGVRRIAWRAVGRCPSNLHPSELGPIVGIVVDNYGGPGVLTDVAAPTEGFRSDALWFFVDRCHDVVVCECKANGHDMRAPLGIGCGQTADPRRLDILPFLALKHVEHKASAGKRSYPPVVDWASVSITRYLTVSR